MNEQTVATLLKVMNPNLSNTENPVVEAFNNDVPRAVSAIIEDHFVSPEKYEDHQEEIFDLRGSMQWNKQTTLEPNMSNTEVFKLLSHIADGLNKTYVQGKVSVRAHTDPLVKPKCMYRNGNGLCCTIGHMITDENYSFDLENTSASNLEVVHTILRSADLPTDMLSIYDSYDLGDALESLQCIHDNMNPENSFGEFRVQFSEKLNKEFEDSKKENFNGSDWTFLILTHAREMYPHIFCKFKESV